MRPSIAVATQHAAVREAAGRHRTSNPRIFGSVVRGTDHHGSDLDLLVDAQPGATLFDPSLSTCSAFRSPCVLLAICLSSSAPPCCRGAAGMNELRAVDFVCHIREAATEALSYGRPCHGWLWGL